MTKKIFLYLSVSASIIQSSFYGFVQAAPEINCEGLPGCTSDANANNVTAVAGTLISTLIQYVAVTAVIAVMISGVMYMLSGGEEEKTKKAKTWIIYSVIAVILSVSAWYIINTLNTMTIFN